jgi:16S rRNA (guanine527-N7)-methyltransferase
MEEAEAGRFDLVVFRAFSPLSATVLKSLSRLLLPHGVIAAYKGRRQTLEEELKAAEAAAPAIAGSWEIVPLAVPFLDEERHLALIYAGARAAQMPGGLALSCRRMP